MRLIIRLAVLALAAVGAKSLYDRFAPQVAASREPAAGVLDSAKGAAKSVSNHARSAASDVARDAREQAARVQQEAAEAVKPPTATEPPSAPPAAPGPVIQSP
jgi:hypothetical protein